MNEHSYIGWVPTVSGRLSFRIIGRTDFPERAYRENEVYKEKRIIVVSQMRYLGDNLFVDLINNILPRARYKFSDKGYFMFSFIGECDLNTDGDRLIGYCFVSMFPKSKKMRDIKGVTRYMRDTLIFLDMSLERLDYAFGLYGFSPVFFSKVCLHRSGIIQFTELSPIDKDGKKLNDKDYHFIANHMYFFIRDISHKHKHHDPSADTMLTLYEVDNNGNWARNILYSLYYNIIEMSRKAKQDVGARGYQGKGILSYATSFKNVIKRLFPMYERAVDMHNDASILMSLESDISKSEIDNRSKINYYIFFVTAVPFVFAAIINYIAPKMAQENFKETLTNYINLFIMIYIFIVIYMLSRIFPFNFSSIYRGKIIKSIFRILMFKPMLFGFAFLFIFAFLSLCSVYFVWAYLQ